MGSRKALSRHIVQDEPELSDHYAILRAARNRVAVETPMAWWRGFITGLKYRQLQDSFWLFYGWPTLFAHWSTLR